LHTPTGPKNYAPLDVEEKLKELAAKAIQMVFALGMEKNTDPAIMRAIMRDITQRVHKFRSDVAVQDLSTAALTAKLGDFDRMLTKHAHQLRGKLKQEHERGHIEPRAMVRSIGLNPHLLEEGTEWLNATLRDLDHGLFNH